MYCKQDILVWNTTYQYLKYLFSGVKILIATSETEDRKRKFQDMERIGSSEDTVLLMGGQTLESVVNIKYLIKVLESLQNNCLKLG